MQLAATAALPPTATRALPSGRAPFAALLGVHGRGVSHGGGDEGGADCCYALHADGSLTIWLRAPGVWHRCSGACIRTLPHARPHGCMRVSRAHARLPRKRTCPAAGELRYTLSCASRLMPPVSRGAAQPLALLAVRAQVWKQDAAVDELMVRAREGRCMRLRVRSWQATCGLSMLGVVAQCGV